MRVIYIFSKYGWAVPLKDKKVITIVNTFQTILNDLSRKQKKIWVDQGSEFYNNCFKKWLEDNDIEIYSAYNEGKFVVAERFIKTWRNKIYRQMTAVSKKCLFDVLDEVGNMKPIDVKSNS